MPHPHENLRQFLAFNSRDARLRAMRRRARVIEALSWPGGADINNKIYEEIWTGRIEEHGYSVELGKPGLESQRPSGKANPDDMHPRILRDGVVVPGDASFEDIFVELEHFKDADNKCLELIGSLVVRSALMLDHLELRPGIWRYIPNETVVIEIERDCPSLQRVPVRAFLHLLDAVAWNEDVKYRDEAMSMKKGKGRVNMLLTCARIISTYMGQIKIAELAMAFIKGRGVAPLTQKKAKSYFPLLVPRTEN